MSNLLVSDTRSESISENVDQSLPIEPYADEQGMRSISDEELEGVIGGARVNPSWERFFNRFNGVAKVINYGAIAVKKILRR